MFVPEKTSVTLKDRLSRLENELEYLLDLQEKRQQNIVQCSDAIRTGNEFQKCPCTKKCCSNNVTKPKILAHFPQTEVNSLTNITKFLQNISINLSRGTQAINKIANLVPQNECDRNRCRVLADSQENMKVSNNLVKSKSAGYLSKLEEDDLFKELREEKDRRISAENKINSLKDELKQIKLLKEELEATNMQLKSEVKELQVKLDSTLFLLETKIKEMQNLNFHWPIKYETVMKELQDEKAKRSEAERNAKNMCDSMVKGIADNEAHNNLQKTANWLKEQNENLMYLTQKLKLEIEHKNNELLSNHTICEDNIKKIKHLTRICEKMRDLLLATKKKYVASKDNLKQNMVTNQKLTNKYLDIQSSLNDLESKYNQSNYEIKRLNELVGSATNSNDALQLRINEMSEVMKQQNHLITQQSETISIKDDQINLENVNKKLMQRRLKELEERNGFETDKLKMEDFNEKITTLNLDLENAKDQAKIKEQILNDHLKTISQLKDVSNRKEEEIYNVKRDLSETKRMLSIEKTTNEQLSSKIKGLQSRKEELKRKLEDLEEDVESKFSMEHTLRLEQLEKQILTKQRDWEDQIKYLTKEHEDTLEQSKHTIKDLSDQLVSQTKLNERHQQLIKDLNIQLEEKQNEYQNVIRDVQNLQAELVTSKESAERDKLSFQEKLQSACESWQKTFKLLQK